MRHSLALLVLLVCTSCRSEPQIPPTSSASPNVADEPVALAWTLEHELAAHTGSVVTAEFSKDGTLLVTGAWDTIVWNPTTGEQLLHLDRPARRVAFSPDVTRMVLATEAQREPQPDEMTTPVRSLVSVHNVEDGAELFRLPVFESRVCLPVYSADGLHLATACETGAVNIWDASDGSLVSSFQTPEAAYAHVPPVGPRSVMLSRDGTRIAVTYLTSWDPSSGSLADWKPWKVAIWDIKSGEDITDKLSETERNSAKPKTFDSSIWAFGTRMAMLPTGGVNYHNQVEFQGHWCIMAVVSPDGTTGLTTHDDGMIRLWSQTTVK